MDNPVTVDDKVILLVSHHHDYDNHQDDRDDYNAPNTTVEETQYLQGLNLFMNNVHQLCD